MTMENTSLTLKSKREGEALTVSLAGRLDTITAPDAERRLREEIEGVKDLTLDLSGLEYISSAGLRVLLALQKIMNRQGKMQLTGVNDTVMEILDLTGFSGILTIAYNS